MDKDVSYTKLYSGTNIEIYLCSAGFLYADWYGYSTAKSVKAGSMKLLEMMVETQCFDIINDNRKLSGTWNPVITWGVEVFMPLILSKGLNRIAHIYSHDIAARFSADKMMEIDPLCPALAFEDFKTASTWLIGKELKEPNLNDSCAFKTNSGLKQVVYEDIYFVSKLDRRTIVQTTQEQIDISNSLKEIVESLPSDLFMRVHKSYIVNLNKIKELKYHAGGYYRAYFKDFGKAYVTISKLHSKELKEAIGV